MDGAAVGITEGVALGSPVGAIDGTDGLMELGMVIELTVMVTAALRARHLPCMVTPVFAVMAVSARMLPTMDAPAPRVAEEPTCQYT